MMMNETEAIHTTNTTDNSDETSTTLMMNYIYPGIRIFALTLTGFAVVCTIYCSIWFYQHRKARIVQSHQPEFLGVICAGILLWEISVIPFSIDNSIVASERGNSIACVASQWLYNIGFTISFAGLYSKLWRINKIFHNPQFRRISVTVYDVLKPFAILFSYTFILLLVWTLVDPPRWERIQINETYVYWSCESDRTGELLSWLLFAGHILVVLATIRQAYMARNVSSDFSETWPLALGLLNWIQLSIIGIPVGALIDYIVPSASYYLGVSIILAQSLTILLAIFLPLFLHPSIRQSPPVIGHTIRVTRSEHHRVTITGTTINDSSIHNHDEDETYHHDAVMEHLGHLSSSTTTAWNDQTTADKSSTSISNEMLPSSGGAPDGISPLPNGKTVLAPIVESSSELKDSSTMSINNSNHDIVIRNDKEEDEETV